MRLYPAERTILLVILALAIADAVLIAWKNVSVGIDFFAFSLIFAAVLIGVGQFYRQYRADERVALMAHIVALFIAYSTFGALFNVLLLPRPAPPIDEYLVRIDAWFGYSWPALCAFIADYPTMSAILRRVYQLTLVQLLFVFLFLGLMLDRRRLHAAALATVLASLFVIFFWAFFPSSGAGGYWSLAPEIDRIVRPLGNSELGAELNRLLREGVTDVSTLSTTGLIGFPSFHTVMALVTLLAVWPYRLARALMIGVNALLLPSILIHGGHHLTDVFGGIAVCWASWLLGLAIVDRQERRLRTESSDGLPDRAVPAA
jgi:hypothetical protein